MPPAVEDIVTISKMSTTTPTMADVGKHAGVGIGTVSRVLNGSVHVSDVTRKKVRESAEALGYQRTRKSAAERGKGGALVAVLV
ncbi:MAG: Bacterial regulatory protein lacI family, partial [Frankiales bacterium]|nr:Bacterial regulatory protein lacI family [Frankiales bacterium]